MGINQLNYSGAKRHAEMTSRDSSEERCMPSRNICGFVSCISQSLYFLLWWYHHERESDCYSIPKYCIRITVVVQVNIICPLQ